MTFAYRAFLSSLLPIAGLWLTAPAPSQDPAKAMDRVSAHLRAEATDGCYRVQWTRIHQRRAAPEAAASLTKLEDSLADSSDFAAARQAVEAYVRTFAGRSQPEPDRSELPDSIETGLAEVAREGETLVALDRREDGSTIRAIATDGTHTLIWDAEGEQLSMFPDRLFAIQADLERLWDPLSLDEARQRTFASLPWVMRPFDDEGQLLRSSRPERRYEIVLDASDRPVQARVFDGDDPDAPPRKHTLYFYNEAGMLCGSLRIARRSRGRSYVDLAVIDERSQAPPPAHRLEVTVPEDTKLFEFGPDRKTRPLSVDKPANWPAFLREHLRIAR